MGHSTTGDLYYTSLESNTEASWRVFREQNGSEVALVEKGISLLWEMSSDERRWFYQNEPLAHTIFEHAAREAVRRVVIAQLDLGPDPAKAYVAALAWLEGMRLNHDFFFRTALEAMILGFATVWVDSAHSAVGLAPPSVVQAFPEGRLLLQNAKGQMFGKFPGEQLYMVTFGGQLDALRVSLVHLLNAMLRDALALTHLEKHRPRVGVLGVPVPGGQSPLTWFPETEELPETYAHTISQHVMLPSSSLHEDVCKLHHVSGIFSIDE